MRFGLETIRRVRRAAGASMAVIIRVAGNDFPPGSHTNQEARVFAAAAEKAGADCIDVTGGWHESRVPQITMDLPQGGYSYLAGGIKKVVSSPVIACNRINDPFVAEEILNQGIGDLVGVARGLIADPEFVKKAQEVRPDEIRRCVACNQKCFDYIVQQLLIGCAVNPQAGRETEVSFGPARTPKQILVVGAGPAGCEFAVTAAQRGHKVVICEKEDRIGGQVAWFASATRNYDFHYLLAYYRAILTKYGVELRMSVEVTSELVSKEHFDLIVVATGATPYLSPIEGLNAPNVFQAWDVLKGNVQTGVNVVVVGGGSVGLQTALFLASKGTISPEQLYFLALHKAESTEMLRDLMLNGVKQVTVIEMGSRIAQDVGRSTRWVLIKELELRGVKLITNAKVRRIASDHVEYTDLAGNYVTFPTDTVVLAMGSRPETSLARKLLEADPDVRVIGDADKCGQVGGAIEAGHTLAATL